MKTVIEMAREAGFMMENSAAIQAAEHFAELVRADECEACAKVCDRMAQRTQDIRSAALESAAQNIRARNPK